MSFLRTRSKTTLHALTVMLFLSMAAKAQTVGWVQLESPSARTGYRVVSIM
jgi:hypothetical protein